MEKIKKFVKKNQILLIAVCVCIAALTVAFFAGGNRSENKVQTASTASSLSTTNADTETTSVSATEKTTQSPTDSAKSNKDKKDRKNSEDKKNSKDNSQDSNSSAVEKSEKSEQSSSNSSSDKKKPSSSSNSSSFRLITEIIHYFFLFLSSNRKIDRPYLHKYKTDPVPSGKPKPVEPEEQETKDTNLYCTFTITCSTILDNIDDLDPEKIELVPKDGIILKKQKVQFKEGESVYDVLVKVCKDNNIHMESSWTPMYNSAYIEGINNLYEFDCGSLSGWMYKVNEWFPNYGCSRYVLKNGDDVVWCYTCNLGYDVGGGYATGE